MNEPITMHPLRGSAALDYLAEVLRNGGASDEGLSFELLPGELNVVVPSNTAERRALDFSTGGLLPAEPVRDIGGALVQEVPTAVPVLAKIVSRQVRLLDDPVLWIHEPMLTEDELHSLLGDEILSGRVRFQKIEGQAYLAYERDIRAEARIAKAINASMVSWHFLAFVTDCIHDAPSVSILVEQAQMILVGAYDGESALVWERKA